MSKSETPKLANTQSERERQILEALENKIFWRSTYIPIQVDMVNSNCPLAMKALIDCNVMGGFIDHEFVQAHKLQTYHLLRPIGLYNADGLPNEIGKITEAIDLIIQCKGHKSWSKFYISSVSHNVIILGHTVMVHPPTLHVLLKPHLLLLQLSLFPNLLDWPLNHLGCQPTSHFLSQTLVCSYYLSLLDTLNFPCLHFNLQSLTLTSASHSQLLVSIPDSCIVVDTVQVAWMMVAWRPWKQGP